MPDDELLAEQTRYYRARAPEYDEWWQRTGRYELDEADTDAWNREIDTVERSLAKFDPRGDVLELAGGTGWWTQRLAATAERLTVVDSSPEALAINRDRVGRDDVDHVVADLFAWQPPRLFDVVFFSFWLSHVPRARFSSFWSFVGDCLTPGGRVFLIDNIASVDGPSGSNPFVEAYETDEHRRVVSDGTRYRVVKVMYTAEDLTTALDAEGWRAQLETTSRFVFGSAPPR